MGDQTRAQVAERLLRHMCRMSMVRHQSLSELRSILATHANVYRVTAGLRGNRQVVHRRSDLVVDGFPKSANSTMEAAIRVTQETDLCLAHHCHSAAQFHLALRFDVPAVLLFRDPMDAVLSYKDALPDHIGFGALLRAYVRLHRSLMPCLDRLILVSFDDVTRDLSGVLSRIRELSGLELTIPTSNHGFDRLVAAKRDHISVGRTGERPRYSAERSGQFHEERDARRNRFRDALEDPSLLSLKEECAGMHGALKLAHTAQVLKGMADD